MVRVIVVANVAVVSRVSYKLHPGNHRTADVRENKGVDNVSLACLLLSFPGML